MKKPETPRTDPPKTCVIAARRAPRAKLNLSPEATLAFDRAMATIYADELRIAPSMTRDRSSMQYLRSKMADTLMELASRAILDAALDYRQARARWKFVLDHTTDEEYHAEEALLINHCRRKLELTEISDEMERRGIAEIERHAQQE